MFHFMRPLWLVALIPSLAVLVLLVRSHDSRRPWRGVVADHLLPHLISEKSRSTVLGPHVLLGLVLILATVAMAGPTWQEEPVPFADDTAALVIVVEVTPTMLAQDVQPSRLERTAHKIKELLAAREGAQTALVAYAGTAHLVMPLTGDGDLVASFAAELAPQIMPLEGDAADQGVKLAWQQLMASGRAGSVLLVTDGVSPAAMARIEAQAVGRPVVHVFGVGAGTDAVVPPGSPPAPALDRAGLEKVSAAGRGSLVVVTPDGRDVQRLSRIVETEFTAAPSPDSGDRWRDFGYWLMPLIAALTLFWFRPGWAVQWRAFVLLFVLVIASSAEAQEGDRVKDRFWFATRDQKAQRLFDQGAFAEAAALFTTPERQGTAWYRAGDFKQAAAAFGRSGTVDGVFNRGNSLVMLGNYEAAIQTFELALEQRPGWQPAVDNLQIARARLDRLRPSEDSEPQKGMSEDDVPDDIVFDDSAKDQQDANTEIVAGEELSDAELRALWLRRVETSPSEFLRRKFAYQHQKALEEGGEQQ